MNLHKYSLGVEDMCFVWVKILHIRYTLSKESFEIYLKRAAENNQEATFIKRYDRLDNLGTLWQAPESFRANQIAETERALPLWKITDPEGAEMIQQVLAKTKYLHQSLINISLMS